MKSLVRTFSALIPVVGLCVVAFAILNKHFLAGLGLLIVAAVSASFMYLGMSKKVANGYRWFHNNGR